MPRVSVGIVPPVAPRRPVARRRVREGVPREVRECLALQLRRRRDFVMQGFRELERDAPARAAHRSALRGIAAALGGFHMPASPTVPTRRAIASPPRASHPNRVNTVARPALDFDFPLVHIVIRSRLAPLPDSTFAYQACGNPSNIAASALVRRQRRVRYNPSARLVQRRSDRFGAHARNPSAFYQRLRVRIRHAHTRRESRRPSQDIRSGCLGMGPAKPHPSAL